MHEDYFLCRSATLHEHIVSLRDLTIQKLFIDISFFHNLLIFMLQLNLSKQSLFVSHFCLDW
jgi:hypothetical protein